MKNILYVGTNKAHQIHYQQQFPAAQIITQPNALQAYDHLSRSAIVPDLIICEERSSGISIFDFANMVRRQKRYDSIIFFAVTASLKSFDKTKALSSGIDDVFTPYFSAKRVAQRIAFLKMYRTYHFGKPNKGREDYKFSGVSLLKRTFDILVASSALIVLSPVLLLVMAAIRIESKGAVFYASKRVGSGYKVFDFYKLRSMYTGADQNLVDLKSQNQYASSIEKEELNSCLDCETKGSQCSPTVYIDGEKMCEALHLKREKAKASGTFVKFKNDPRITKVGKFIRNTSIDELPQLINVLKGDMSIVGNRPLPLYEAEQLTADGWAERFNAPAGLTGLWQVEKRGGGSMSEDERKMLDIKYARANGFWYDVKLILRTVPALFQSENV